MTANGLQKRRSSNGALLPSHEDTLAIRWDMRLLAFLVALSACTPATVHTPTPVPPGPPPIRRHYGLVQVLDEVIAIDKQNAWSPEICATAIEKARYAEPNARGLQNYVAGVVFDRCGRKEDAKKEMERAATQLSKGSPERATAMLWLTLGELNERGDPWLETAAERLRGIVVDVQFRHADVLLELARVQLRMSRQRGDDALREEARKNILRAIAVDSAQPALRVELVRYHLEEAGVPSLVSSVALAPEDSPRRRLALQRASIVAEGALKVFPEHAPLHYAKGRVASAQGIFDKAADAFAKAAELDPSLVEAHLALGSTFLQLRLVEPAVTAFRGALAHDAKRYEALLGLGIALRAGGTPAGLDEAVKLVERAMALAPERAPAHFEAALIALRRHSEANARRHLKRFVALAGDTPSLTAARQRAVALLEEIGS